MASELKVPALGEGVDSGDVLEVLVKVGDTIQINDNIVELETDKATVMIPADAAGKVTQIHIASGNTVKVGQTLLTLESSAVPVEAKKSPAPPASKAEAPVPTAAPPKQPAKPTIAATPVAPSVSVASTASKAQVVSPVAEQPASAPSRSVATSLGSGQEMAAIAAGPAIRRFAREVGVDLRAVEGTGNYGRVTRDDVLKVVRSGTAKTNGANATTGTGQSDHWGPIRVEKLSKVRATIAQKMHESWTTVPRVTNFDDADVTELEHIRQGNKKDYEARGIKLTSMPFLIKAVAMSLRSHPIINATIDLTQNQVVYKDYVNIGIAVDTERGLVVPSLRGADKLAIPDIARSLSEIAESVRNNKYTVDDLRGGTFTISNLGAIGGTYSTPIINIPETAILLVGKSRRLPVVVDDQVAIRLMMPLSLSYDHRLIDGAAAARFLNDIIAYLESPSRLLLAL